MRTYFIQAGSGPVKIGISGDVTRRMGLLSTATHELLCLLGSIDGDHEVSLHRRFATDRIRGEWFRPTKALLAFVSENSSPEPENESGRRGATIAVQFFIAEDRIVREIAAREQRSAADMVRLLALEAVQIRQHETKQEGAA
jgi:hypothetical protein